MSQNTRTNSEYEIIPVEVFNMGEKLSLHQLNAESTKNSQEIACFGYLGKVRESGDLILTMFNKQVYNQIKKMCKASLDGRDASGLQIQLGWMGAISD